LAWILPRYLAGLPAQPAAVVDFELLAGNAQARQVAGDHLPPAGPTAVLAVRIAVRIDRLEQGLGGQIQTVRIGPVDHVGQRGDEFDERREALALAERSFDQFPASRDPGSGQVLGQQEAEKRGGFLDRDFDRTFLVLHLPEHHDLVRLRSSVRTDAAAVRRDRFHLAGHIDE
jgi:hypothetical protein